MVTLLAAALMLSPLAIELPVADTPYTLVRSAVAEILSPDGHRYRLFLSWPEGPAPPEGWPVLYLLDGADHFASATELARRLAMAGRRTGVDAGIIVGIDSGPLARRVLDYTPASGNWRIPAAAPAHGLATGGADAFLDFLQHQVQQLVAARWRVDPARQTLAGHSFGGLLALHALFTRPTLATRYAAVSPSLWFGGDLLAREERAARVSGRRILVAVGDDERGLDGSAGAAGEALTRRLTIAGADARFLALSGQDHGTAMPAAMGRIVALAFGKGR